MYLMQPDNNNAQSYLYASSHLAGCAVELATSQKEAKYASFSQSFLFQPAALESLCSTAPSSSDFLCEMGRWLSAAAVNIREMVYLLQRLSVAIQRYNSVRIYESFTAPDVQPDN